MNKPIHPSATSGAVSAVIYARYSSEHQRETSIEDQVRTCKARIEAEGWTLVATYTDYAQSEPSPRPVAAADASAVLGEFGYGREDIQRLVSSGAVGRTEWAMNAPS
jgi:hypothetical protein